MDEVIQWTAGCLSVGVGIVAVILRPRGLASWNFFAGMLLLAMGQWLRIFQDSPLSQGSLVIESIVPGVWLGFSLIYARGNRGEFLARWKWLLPLSVVVPLALVSGLLGDLMLEESAPDEGIFRHTITGKLWLVALLLTYLAILVNLEKTFRASVGMARWRIKYLFLGLCLIFGLRVYGLSQALLYSSLQPSLAVFESLTLIIGCVLIALGHTRSSFGQLDIYPSRTLLQGSITVVLAGAYFLIVGLLAQLVGYLGGASSLPAQAFLLLLGLVAGALLLLSDRFRSWLKRFVSRHFHRPEHDFRKLWADFTRRTSNVLDEEKLVKQAAGVISESFQVLGVSVFRTASEGAAMQRLYSTDAEKSSLGEVKLEGEAREELFACEGPFNLEKKKGAIGEILRESSPSKFGHGGDRFAMPLRVADRLIGMVVLADRVNGIPYSQEEIDLLACIADQFAAGLLNCSLTEENLEAKELEAFQTLSTFFVHDLKNAANSLNLTLQNLPVHFDDPEFRKDTIAAVGRTVERINKMILNLSSLRHELQLRREPTKLGPLIEELLDQFEQEGGGRCVFTRNIGNLPEVLVDSDAIASVFTNLVANARESIATSGTVGVRAEATGDGVRVVVEDDGCGMSGEFVRDHLFRPFHSTKSKGLGIGMFQCKKVVEAHGGALRVESEEGRGSRFTIELPMKPREEGETIRS